MLLDASDGTDTWGAIGVPENVIEASWDALVDSLEAGMLPGRARRQRRAGRGRRPACVSTAAESIPLARPVLGEAEEQAVLEVLRSGQLSLGPRVPAFEEAFAARVGAPHASAVSSARRRCTWRCARSACEEGDEVVTSPFSFVASANAILYERARPVFADIDPVTLNLDPAAAAAAISAAHDGAAAGAHLRLPGRHAGARARTGCRSSRTPARRSARVHARRQRRSAAAAIRRRSASTPTSR